MIVITENLMFAGLGIVILLVLVLPFVVKKIEHNLEVFLFIMGLIAVLISGELNKELAIKAFEEPIMISGAVLIAGVLFKLLKNKINLIITNIQERIPARFLFFLIVVVLGLISSMITAIIAALVLVEIVN